MELGGGEGRRKKRDRSEGPNCAKKKKREKERQREVEANPYSANRVRGRDGARMKRRFLHPAAIAKFHGNAASREISREALGSSRRLGNCIK